MPTPEPSFVGQKFNRLTVLGRAPPSGGSWGRVFALCDCGITKSYRLRLLQVGRTKSCGCLKHSGDLRRTHGHATLGAPSRTYRSWRSMRTRCTNPRSTQWKHYGGRGITICERWALFENFLADMGERPPGLTLDRIDNGRGYEPENCQWATPKTQANNRRKTSTVDL